jgi:ribosome-associated protein
MDKAKEMAKIAFRALDEKKGEDIRIIDISQVSTVADYFIIAHGNSTSQVNALVDNVEEQLGKAGHDSRQKEGYNTGAWVLLDYADIIVHVFDKDNRSFYNLERIWSDGREVNTEEL